MVLSGLQIYLRDGDSRHLSGSPLSKSDGEGQDRAQPKILVVDYEKLLADTTAAVLRNAGYNARTAYDGFGALEVAGFFRPDYLLTDIMMPAMNGVELAIAVTRMYPATKILLFSGQTGISDILKESQARGFEFPLLAKPVHPAKLVEHLRLLKGA